MKVAVSAEALKKSTGTTPTERHLSAICERSFLSLWSYPNIFRDQGGGKELCDLLVVFQDDVIIFSDKSCIFLDSGNAQTDWSRWYRRSIRASAKQVFGAERWLRSFPKRVFLDQSCAKPFPLDLSNPGRFRFHRVVVATGAAERCRLLHGGSGSLMITGTLPDGPVDDRVPFLVGHIFPDRPYVHVFDEVTLGVVLTELDTITDFTAYLGKKERFITEGKLGMAPGEEDLLGSYARTTNDSGEHDFPSHPGSDLIFLDEGFWTGLLTQPDFIARKERDRTSYLWDYLIETFAKHIVSGTLAHGNELGILAHERGLRVMASESRLGRRTLGMALGEMFETTKPNETRTRMMVSALDPNIAYIFCLVSPAGYANYETYRAARTSRVVSYCHVAKHLHPSLTQVVGIGVEPNGNRGGSEDLVYLEARLWSPEQAEMARGLHEEGGLFRSAHERRFTEKEYPIVPIQVPANSKDARREHNRSKRERRRRSGRR